MVVEKTVEIPASHRLVLDVPPEIPAGRAILTFSPAAGVSGKERRRLAIAQTFARTVPQNAKSVDCAQFVREDRDR